jgi:hypothetical protein
VLPIESHRVDTDDTARVEVVLGVAATSGGYGDDGQTVGNVRIADLGPLEMTFAQRFTGTLSADGNTIDAMWQTTEDSATWRKDFALSYTRIAVP